MECGRGVIPFVGMALFVGLVSGEEIRIEVGCEVGSILAAAGGVLELEPDNFFL